METTGQSANPPATGMDTAAFLMDLDKMRAPTAFAEVFSSEVPLSPANGGREINSRELALGDILLLTQTGSDIPVSLRDENQPAISQAAIFIGKDAIAVEDDQGLRECSLQDALRNSRAVVVLRHPFLNGEKAGQLIAYLHAAAKAPAQGVRFGLIRKLLVQIEPQYCAGVRPEWQEKCSHFAGRIQLHTPGNNAFYIGRELLGALQKTTLSLTHEPADWQQAGEAPVPLTYNGVLRYVGHLKLLQ
jgi:hypothetical protein